MKELEEKKLKEAREKKVPALEGERFQIKVSDLRGVNWNKAIDEGGMGYIYKVCSIRSSDLPTRIVLTEPPRGSTTAKRSP